MEKKIEDYAHFYIGSQCIWARKRGNAKNRCLITISDLPWLLSKNVFKPILRPLSDMTEEEAEEKRQYLMIQNYDGLEFFDTFPMHNAYEMKWMLSKGFDIFQLIEAGLAIDKTKL